MGRIGIWLRNLAIIAVLATFAFLFGQPQGTDPASAPVAVTFSRPSTSSDWVMFVK